MKYAAFVLAVISFLAFEQVAAQATGVITTGCGKLPNCPGPFEVAACCEPCYSIYCYYLNRNCGKNCVKGCYCKLGYVQLRPMGPCVPKILCRTKGKK